MGFTRSFLNAMLAVAELAWLEVNRQLLILRQLGVGEVVLTAKGVVNVEVDVLS